MYAALLRVIAGLLVTAATVSCLADNKGTRFVLAFMENRELLWSPVIRIYLTSENYATVHISIPWEPNKYGNVTLSVTPGGATMHQLPHSLHMTGTAFNGKCVLVESTSAITVQGASVTNLSSDGFLALPQEALGTEYYIMSYLYKGRTFRYDHGPTQFAIIALEDETEVYVTLPRNMLYKGKATFRIRMTTYEAFQFQSQGDVTGALVRSNTRVAVFSGTVWTAVGGLYMGDHLNEQLVPTNFWGKRFLVPPLATRTAGDVYRVIAKDNDTRVRISVGTDGLLPIFQGTHILGAGQYADFDGPSDAPVKIDSSGSVLLAQFSKSYQADNVRDSDPMMCTIPPISHYTSRYTFSTVQSFSSVSKQIVPFKNFLSLVIPTGSLSEVFIDGSPLTSAPYYNFWNLSAQFQFHIIILNISDGYHVVESQEAVFGAMLYGFKFQESYGLPLGQTFKELNGSCEQTFAFTSDEFDNDCDGLIDEEVLNQMDDDSDGVVDEDVRDDLLVPRSRTNTESWVGTDNVTSGADTPRSGSSLTEVLSYSDDPLTKVPNATTTQYDSRVTPDNERDGTLDKTSTATSFSEGIATSTPPEIANKKDSATRVDILKPSEETSDQALDSPSEDPSTTRPTVPGEESFLCQNDGDPCATGDTAVTGKDIMMPRKEIGVYWINTFWSWNGTLWNKNDSMSVLLSVSNRSLCLMLLDEIWCLNDTVWFWYKTVREVPEVDSWDYSLIVIFNQTAWSWTKNGFLERNISQNDRSVMKWLGRTYGINVSFSDDGFILVWNNAYWTWTTYGWKAYDLYDSEALHYPRFAICRHATLWVWNGSGWRVKTELEQSLYAAVCTVETRISVLSFGNSWEWNGESWVFRTASGKNTPFFSEEIFFFIGGTWWIFNGTSVWKIDRHYYWTEDISVSNSSLSVRINGSQWTLQNSSIIAAHASQETPVEELLLSHSLGVSWHDHFWTFDFAESKWADSKVLVGDEGMPGVMSEGRYWVWQGTRWFLLYEESVERRRQRRAIHQNDVTLKLWWTDQAWALHHSAWYVNEEKLDYDLNFLRPSVLVIGINSLLWVCGAKGCNKTEELTINSSLAAVGNSPLRIAFNGHTWIWINGSIKMLQDGATRMPERAFLKHFGDQLTIVKDGKLWVLNRTVWVKLNDFDSETSFENTTVGIIWNLTMWRSTERDWVVENDMIKQELAYYFPVVVVNGTWWLLNRTSATIVPEVTVTADRHRKLLKADLFGVFIDGIMWSFHGSSWSIMREGSSGGNETLAVAFNHTVWVWNRLTWKLETSLVAETSTIAPWYALNLTLIYNKMTFKWQSGSWSNSDRKELGKDLSGILQIIWNRTDWVYDGTVWRVKGDKTDGYNSSDTSVGAVVDQALLAEEKVNDLNGETSTNYRDNPTLFLTSIPTGEPGRTEKGAIGYISTHDNLTENGSQMDFSNAHPTEEQTITPAGYKPQPAEVLQPTTESSRDKIVAILVPVVLMVLLISLTVTIGLLCICKTRQRKKKTRQKVNPAVAKYAVPRPTSHYQDPPPPEPSPCPSIRFESSELYTGPGIESTRPSSPWPPRFGSGRRSPRVSQAPPVNLPDLIISLPRGQHVRIAKPKPVTQALGSHE